MIKKIFILSVVTFIILLTNIFYIEKCVFAQDVLVRKASIANLKKKRENEQYLIEMSRYYNFKKQGKLTKAEHLLYKILQKFSWGEEAQKEMGYLLLGKGEKQEALQYFLAAEKINPKNEHTKLQIGYLYAELGDNDKAKEVFKQLTRSRNNEIRDKAVRELSFYQAKKLTISKKIVKSPVKYKRLDQMLNDYYSQKKKDKYRAQRKLMQIIKLYPNNTDVLLERGYFLLEQKRYREALPLFQKVSALQPNNYTVKEQLAYTYEHLKQYKNSFHMFKITSYSPDPKMAQRSRNALINLSSWQSKMLPSPWFAEAYFAPAYYSRFNLSIIPFFLRVGVELGEHQRLKIYVRSKYTYDSRSIGGLLPSIYEDNAAIFSAGVSYRPIIKFPVDFYAEGGRAYDLIDRNRARWRSDFRSGLVGYKNWGATPVYAPQARFVLKPVGDIYGDVSYYTRYDDNIIGQFLLRQGFRIFELCNSSISIYAKGQYFFDTKREYYNNVVEYGGGIAFVPHNHINFVIRIEGERGTYIHVNSPNPNPHPKSNYYNTIITADFYIKL